MQHMSFDRWANMNYPGWDDSTVDWDDPNCPKCDITDFKSVFNCDYCIGSGSEAIYKFKQEYLAQLKKEIHGPVPSKPASDLPLFRGAP